MVKFGRLSRTTIKKKSIASIFLIALIDMLGVGIIIPVLAPLIIDNSTGLFAADFPVEQRDIVFGFMVACFPVAQFFGAPILGSLSDRYGRKPVLLFSLFGSLVGFLLFGYAILENNLYLMFFSRFLDGFTGGNLSVIYSAVSDVSDQKSRATNFGVIGMAFGIGFILGPATGGLLSDSSIVSWFNMATPFWLTSGLCAANLVLIWFLFEETLRSPSQTPIRVFTGLKNVGKAFTLPNLRIVFTSRFFLVLGFSFFTQFFNVFLVKKFSFGPGDIGFLFGYVGIWIAAAQGGLVRILSKWLPPESVVRVASFVLAASLIAVIFPSESWMLYVVAPFIAISQGLLNPNLTAVVSLQATEAQQGEILGVNQSVLALGQVIPPFIGGYLSSLDGTFPIWASMAFTVVGGMVFLFGYNSSNENQES